MAESEKKQTQVTSGKPRGRPKKTEAEEWVKLPQWTGEKIRVNPLCSLLGEPAYNFTCYKIRIWRQFPILNMESSQWYEWHPSVFKFKIHCDNITFDIVIHFKPQICFIYIWILCIDMCHVLLTYWQDNILFYFMAFTNILKFTFHFE